MAGYYNDPAVSERADNPNPQPAGGGASGAADWEAFYRSYRKPGYVPGFEITMKLGGGACGLVFKARKESIGKDYAIKFLQVDDTAVREAVFRELDQVRYFAQIDHPNLVQIEDRGEVDGIPYLVMQYAGSETLRDRVTDGGPAGPAERDEVLQLFLQVCRGVAALHERALVHFDLKPANVFLKGSVARVGDYGLSKLVSHSRGSLSMGRGTPYYMAPEILQRRGDQRSDIYSLGVMLYELLTGNVPFRGDSEWEVLHQHENVEPEWPAHLRPADRAVLRRCLSKAPSARFESVEQLITALAQGRAPAGIAAAERRVVPPPLPSARGRSVPVPPPLPTAAATASAGPVPPPPPSASPSGTTPASGPEWRRAPASIQPPPPPADAASAGLQPPPLPKRSSRRRSSNRRGSPFAILVPLLLVVVGAFLFVANRAADRPHASSVRSAQNYVLAEHGDGSARGGHIKSRLDSFVKRARQRVRSAERRRRSADLQGLPWQQLGAPGNMPVYMSMVERIAEAPRFSTGHALRLEREGRPIFLAAVAMLQEYDYGDGEDCRRASHTTELLVHLTGLSGLRIQWDAFEPERAETCRFAAVADAWRELAEEFAASDDAYRRLRAAGGRGRG